MKSEKKRKKDKIRGESLKKNLKKKEKINFLTMTVLSDRWIKMSKTKGMIKPFVDKQKEKEKCLLLIFIWL